LHAYFLCPLLFMRNGHILVNMDHPILTKHAFSPALWRTNGVKRTATRSGYSRTTVYTGTTDAWVSTINALGTAVIDLHLVTNFPSRRLTHKTEELVMRTAGNESASQTITSIE
jgi:hypothetical protein